MARTKSGGFNRFLELIGLVDDEDQRDTYDDEYEAEEYNRSQAYTPRRETRAPERPQMTRRRGSEPEPTRVPESSRTRDYRNGAQDRNTDNRSYRGNNRRTVGSYASTHNTTPRNERVSRNPFTGEQEVKAPAQEARASRTSSSRQRTIMFSVRALEDCCDVIDNLLLNNTVLLNMEELDESAMQRCVDTLSGAVFALHATIRKISERTYVLAPMNVEVDEAYNQRRI